MQTENCHLRSGSGSLDVEVFVDAFADVAFEMVLGLFVKVIGGLGGLDILAVGKMVAALISWHNLCL